MLLMYGIRLPDKRLPRVGGPESVVIRWN